jgi:hypothetical protein
MSTFVDTTGITISTQMSRFYYPDLCHLLQLRTVRMHTTKSDTLRACTDIKLFFC